MKHCFFIFSLGFLYLSCANSNEVSGITPNEDEIAQKKPNILLVIADDMGVDAAPGYDLGSVKPYMPNLQSLINNGVQFTNLWSYAVCTPTRASILTGKYGFRTQVTGVGQELSVNETSIQAYLDSNNAGYEHAVIGKWHLSSDVNHPNNLGVDYFAGIMGGGVGSYWNWNLVENGITSRNKEYATKKFTDLAINWIKEQTQPWFLWLAYNAPHTPFHFPDEALHYQGNLPSDQASIDTNPLPYYMAMLEAMDTEMGRLLASMSDEERNNTIIIFIGDNGTPNKVVQSYPNRRAKNSIYQGGVNVPMVISGKNVSRKGIREDALLNSTDLFATIANMAGVEVSEVNDSKNFSVLLDAEGEQIRDYAFAELLNNAGQLDYAIRDETYKYIKFSNGTEALYNLITDPLESNDLLASSQSELNDMEAKALDALKLELNNIIP